MAGVRFAARIRDFFFLSSKASRLALEPTQPPMFPRGVKRPEREGNHSPPGSAEVKNDGAIPRLNHTSSLLST
jgi:hypothetical protein